MSLGRRVGLTVSSAISYAPVVSVVCPEGDAMSEVEDSHKECYLWEWLSRVDLRDRYSGVDHNCYREPWACPGITPFRSTQGPHRTI
jgi:hypothetical protein